MRRLGAFFRALDRVDSQWLAAWALSAFMATLVVGTVLMAATTPLMERTKTQLLHLELSGAYPLLRAIPAGRLSTTELLLKWRANGLLGAATHSQRIDLAFGVAYGLFFLALALALWRAHPDYPAGGRWVWCLALGTLAALLDEFENACLLWVLARPDDPGHVVPALASALAVAKFLLFVPVLLALVPAVWRARA